MEEKKLTPEEKLDLSLTHSNRLGNYRVNLNSKSLPCGFPSIERYDYMEIGEGKLIVLAARPGNGKTAFSSQIALNVASWGRVLYVSLEMSKEALKKRLLAVESQIPYKKLGLSIHKDKLQSTLEALSRYKLDIIDEQGIDVNTIIRYIYDENQRDKIDLVVIDYVGLIRMDNNNRADEIGVIAYKLKKQVSEKLAIPVILLAQMKRGFEDKYTRARMDYERAKMYANSTPNPKILEIRPAMEDLAESSKLEAATDVVMFLHRPHLLNPEEPPSLFKVYVVKNRHGEIKDFNLEFTQSLTRFRDLEV